MLAAGSFADEASPRPKANTLDEGMLSPRSAEFARFGKRRNSAFAEKSWHLWSIQFSVSKTKLPKWISSMYENLSEVIDILNLSAIWTKSDRIHWVKPSCEDPSPRMWLKRKLMEGTAPSSVDILSYILQHWLDASPAGIPYDSLFNWLFSPSRSLKRIPSSVSWKWEIVRARIRSNPDMFGGKRTATWVPFHLSVRSFIFAIYGYICIDS